MGTVTEVPATLRAARARAGLTLEEISSRTKIKVAFLQALEQGDFARLPGDFFVRAFLRTYARELHLSPEEVVAAYDARNGPVPQVAEAPRAAPVLRSSPALNGPSFALPAPRRLWPTAVVAVGVVALVAVMNRTEGDQAPVAPVVGTSGLTPPAPPSPPAVVPQKTPEKLTIDIRPARKMWVAGMADGKRVIYRLVDEGEHVRIDAHEDMWFRVGDAGAFVYSINGSPEKPLGGSGEVREFRITQDNYRTQGR